MTKTITHGQMLSITSPKGEKVFATAFSVVGYYRVAGYDDARVARFAERNAERGEPMFTSINPGSSITNSPAFYEKERAERAGAIELVDGEEVLFEGQRLAVRFVRAGVSDPISFRPVTVEV